MGENSSAQAKTRANVPASLLTTFGLGGTVDTLYEPQSMNELNSLLLSLSDRNSAYTVLGAGSNVIFPDTGLHTPVIRLGRGFSGYGFAVEDDALERLVSGGGWGIDTPTDEPRVFVVAGGASSLMTLSRELSARGLSGLEFAAGIPASIGGAVRMNAGAHHHSMSDVVRRVCVAEPGGGLKILTAEALKYGYRSSAVGPRTIVLAAELELIRADPEFIRTRRSECLDYRKRTQPLHMPSSGSVFKNPSRETSPSGSIGTEQPRAAAELLEAVGLKGYRLGGVGYSEMHSNWLVRLADDGKASDAAALVELGRKRVHERFGILLESEILFLDG